MHMVDTRFLYRCVVVVFDIGLLVARDDRFESSAVDLLPMLVERLRGSRADTRRLEAEVVVAVVDELRLLFLYV